jgi:hypothetical protein
MATFIDPLSPLSLENKSLLFKGKGKDAGLVNRFSQRSLNLHSYPLNPKPNGLLDPNPKIIFMVRACLPVGRGDASVM